MDVTDSCLDSAAIGRVRALLRAPTRRERVWPTVAAAGLAAISALAFAVAMVMAPPTLSRHLPADGSISAVAK
jgi:peptidoglycan/LPS O-acetylase OafA/YrhL